MAPNELAAILRELQAIRELLERMILAAKIEKAIMELLADRIDKLGLHNDSCMAGGSGGTRG